MSKINLKYLLSEAQKEYIAGGKSSGMTISDIAKKHEVGLSVIERQIKMGVKIEMEHTTNPKIAREIAMDHVYEFVDYYTKLKKMERSMGESNLTLSKYMRLVETSLEDMSIFDEDDTEENIELLHEIEYKFSQLIKNRWAVHPKLFKNVLVRFANIAVEIYELLEPKFSDTFRYWSNMHNVESAEEFTNMVVAEFEEGSGVNWVEEVFKHGIHRGNISIPANEITGSVSNDAIYDMLSDNYDLVDTYVWAAKSFLEENGVEIPEDTDDEEEFCSEYITDNDLEDNFKRYLADTYAAEDLFGEIPQSEEIVRAIIAGRLYDEYVSNFGSAIENIKEEISEHDDRVSGFDVDSVRSEIERLQVTPPDSDEIQEIADTLYSSGIAVMARIISLAMNIDHVSGNISSDYGDYGGLSIDRQFYDKMHSGDVSDWDSELKSIIKPKRV